MGKGSREDVRELGGGGWVLPALLILVGCATPPAHVAATDRSASPAFDCSRAAGSVEEMVCTSPPLASLDRRLDALYRDALTSFPPEELDTLRATQRGWIKGRNDCWKAQDPNACVNREYALRITELQIATGEPIVPEPVVYRCDDGAVLSVYFYVDTQLAAAVVNRHPDQVIAFRAPSASGARYEGRNLAFWTKGDSALLEWHGEETRCRRTGAR